MNYNEFKNTVQAWPVIISRNLMLHCADKQIIRNQLERWHARKLLIKLRRGFFLLNSSDRKINASRMYIANQLYSPSYVSLEYALGYYGLIPERVSGVTGVTTRKTMRISNELGDFTYQHVKPAAFRGFKALKDEAGLVFFIAEPEKALVDFFYFNLSNFKERDKRIFEESYRLQNFEALKTERLMAFAGIFGSSKLMRVVKSFCEFCKEGVGDD